MPESIRNIQNYRVIALDCLFEDGDLICGLLVVDARTSSPQTIVDVDTGFRYKVQLPEQLESQGVTASLDNARMIVLTLGD